MLWSGSVKAGKNFSYQYGPDNLRYKKTVNNTETLYFWDGDTLIGESDGVNDTQYVYDGSGIAGMLYNGAFLYFEKNLFGDVLKAYNMSGTEVASFTYDSYGNILSQSGSLAHAVKMRYRGYYWDEETGFYYLQSRYYDPSICRFISADQYELLPTLSASLGELNLYAYCSNNPVMYTDESGEGIVLTLAIVFGVIGAIAGGVHMGMKAYNAGYEGWDLAGAIIAGAALGGVIGAGLGAVIGMAAPGIATFLGSSFTLFNTVSAAGELVSVSVTGAQLVATGVGALILWSTWQRGSWPGDDPTIPPGDGFEWHGQEPVGGDQGAWVNPITKDSLHPDLMHPQGIAPHWDWINKLLKIRKRIFR